MSNDEVRRLLGRLRSELEHTELDAETRAALAQLDTDIHGVLGADEHEGYDVVEQARRLESTFAAEHPTANRVLREIIDTLGKLGI
ncbi:MAG: DUF4404 family protein [Pseudomonadota bacterium]